jgi:hypothetical protein
MTRISMTVDNVPSRPHRIGAALRPASYIRLNPASAPDHPGSDFAAFDNPEGKLVQYLLRDLCRQETVSSTSWWNPPDLPDFIRIL